MISGYAVLVAEGLERLREASGSERWRVGLIFFLLKSVRCRAVAATQDRGLTNLHTPCHFVLVCVCTLVHILTLFSLYSKEKL